MERFDCLPSMLLIYVFCFFPCIIQILAYTVSNMLPIYFPSSVILLNDISLLTLFVCVKLLNELI